MDREMTNLHNQYEQLDQMKSDGLLSSRERDMVCILNSSTNFSYFIQELCIYVYYQSVSYIAIGCIAIYIYIYILDHSV